LDTIGDVQLQPGNIALREVAAGHGKVHRHTASYATTRPIYGALDLGTNNCRLLMAAPVHDGFEVVEAYSRATRLGEGLARTGALSDIAMQRTIATLGECARRLERRAVTRVRVVATEACRRADNGAEFLRRVHAETGLAIEIISPDEEARMALAGCTPLLAPTPADALVFDIGGGSTELIKVCMRSPTPTILALESLPVGVVNLAETDTLMDPDGYAAIVDDIERRLLRFDEDGTLRTAALAGNLQMLGTSGTVTTLASVHLGQRRYDRAKVDGLFMDFADVAAVSRQLVTDAVMERTTHPCIGVDRADLVVAGCAILEAICRRWPAGRLRVADRGVREGLLLSMMREDRDQYATS
jgi:exopolyphosphatase/guanosine-5'-triphosphate,3'-diphosphate pyrophosphatase